MYPIYLYTFKQCCNWNNWTIQGNHGFKNILRYSIYLLSLFKRYCSGLLNKNLLHLDLIQKSRERERLKMIVPRLSHEALTTEATQCYYSLKWPIPQAVAVDFGPASLLVKQNRRKEGKNSWDVKNRAYAMFSSMSISIQTYCIDLFWQSPGCFDVRYSVKG